MKATEHVIYCRILKIELNKSDKNSQKFGKNLVLNFILNFGHKNCIKNIGISAILRWMVIDQRLYPRQFLVLKSSSRFQNVKVWTRVLLAIQSYSEVIQPSNMYL